jgi:cytochrome P450
MSVDQVNTAQSIRRIDDLPLYKCGIPVFGSLRAFRQNPLTFHLEPYRRFGSAYWIQFVGRRIFVLAGLAANTFVWKNGDAWRYHESQKYFREAFDASYLLQLDGAPHRAKRRRLSHGYRHTDLISSIPRMCQALHRELAHIKSTTTDLRLLCDRLTIAMHCQAILQLDLPEGMDANVNALQAKILQMPLLGPLRNLGFRSPFFTQLKRSVFAVINQLLDDHAARSSIDNDIWSAILKAHPADEPPVQRQELAYDLFLLFEAGAEVTAHLLLWALLYIYRHPAWLAELRAELASYQEGSCTDLSNWPKLMATVFEIERLRPPVPFHTLSAADTIEFEGFCIPQGTLIQHIGTLTHFLPEIYDNPMQFCPQRFLQGNRYPPEALATYGYGIRSCIGKGMVRIIIPLAIAHIVTHYDIQFNFEPSFRPKMTSVITPAESALPVSFSTRR